MTEQQLITYRAAIAKLVPRWLRKGTTGPGIAGKVLYALGVQLDAMADALVAGVKRRFPGYQGQYDSLPACGADRRVARGPAETDAGYAARLLLWLDPIQGHPTRGGPYAMLAQLHGYWVGAFPIALVYRTGARFLMATDGTITRDTIAWGDTGIATWTLVFRWTPPLNNDGLWGDPGLWGDGGVWGSDLTPTTVADLLLVPTEWNSADARGQVTLAPPIIWADVNQWQDGTLVMIPVY